LDDKPKVKGGKRDFADQALFNLKDTTLDGK